ncbi:MAG: HEAT repeat domain-containing protein [Caulobacteraceae bacterium]|nr:HEAT repeat domain-containing protein [Caulobacteraceae bacterium]
MDAAADGLAQATCDVDWRVRLKASEAIGRLGLWRRADCLAPLLDDPVWWVRFRAEEALKRLSPPSRQEPDQVTAGARAKRRAVSTARERRR